MPIQKLRSFYVNDLVRDTGGAHVEKILEIATDAITNESAKRLTTSSKFTLWYVPGLFFCSYQGRAIGFLEHTGSKAEFSFVASSFKGNGLGYKLYEIAISRMGVLRSSTSLSAGSAKIWQALCAKHKGHVKLGDLLIPISGFEVRRGVPFPKVTNKSGDVVVLDPEESHISRKEQFERVNYVYEVRKA